VGLGTGQPHKINQLKNKMVVKTKKIKSAGRFGARYGRAVKSSLFKLKLNKKS
jgi:hypothetical protein